MTGPDSEGLQAGSYSISEARRGDVVQLRDGHRAVCVDPADGGWWFGVSTDSNSRWFTSGQLHIGCPVLIEGADLPSPVVPSVGAVPVEVTEEGARLDEWDRLTQAATAGPWSAADEHGLLECAEPAWCVSRMRPGYEAISETEGYLYDIAYTTGTNEQADAEFIAAARDAVPALIADLRASRAREAELAVELQHVLDTLRKKRTEIVDIADERDVLQQRIDKARQLTVRQFIGPARFKAEGYERTVHELAAALTGTEPDRA